MSLGDLASYGVVALLPLATDSLRDKEKVAFNYFALHFNSEQTVPIRKLKPKDEMESST